MSDSLRPPWSVAHQAPLSMGFSRQEYWSGLPRSSLGNLPDSGTQPRDETWVSCILGRFFTIWDTREAHVRAHTHTHTHIYKCIYIQTKAMNPFRKQFSLSQRISKGIHGFCLNHHCNSTTQLVEWVVTVRKARQRHQVILNKASVAFFFELKASNCCSNQTV